MPFPHGKKRKATCRECKGSAFCWTEGHSGFEKQKSECRDCKGSAFCWTEGHSGYEKFKRYCRECKGSALCWTEGHSGFEKRKSRCRDCKGSAFCWTEGHPGYEKWKHYCRDCKGSALCWTEGHSGFETRKRYCRECGGSALCKRHLKQVCRECDPIGHLKSSLRSRINSGLKAAHLPKTKRTLEYLGCTLEFYRAYLQEKFQEGMKWENWGKGSGTWQIDHVCPVQFKRDGKKPTGNEVETRLHYTNTQPLWSIENMAKGNRFVG